MKKQAKEAFIEKMFWEILFGFLNFERAHSNTNLSKLQDRISELTKIAQKSAREAIKGFPS